MPPQSHSPSSTSSAPALGSPGAALVRAAEVAARDPTNPLPLQPVASGSQSPPMAASVSASSASTSQPKKRGRKRINEPLDNINGNTSLDADEKRKLQNRAAQRAFRERKEKHLAELEARVEAQDAILASCRGTIHRPPTSVPPATNGAPTSTVASPLPSLPAETAVTMAKSGDAAASFSSALSLAFAADVDSKPVIAPPHEGSKGAPSTESTPAPPVSLAEVDMAALDELSFDFDAPFDFSESISLPPIFSSLLDDLALPPLSNSVSSGPSSPSYEAEDACPGDDDEPPPLPNGRIPCEKPECDFGAVSCALPLPWRPPTIAGDDKNLWVAQKCWAKLLSHPLFTECDSDDLCQELRNKTRCSSDGRLVCHKSDVCDIFRSIPQKAKLRAAALSMQ
ncbi:hypothetical protein Rhopal_002678-T1 [Rhodotorula paludigena]|uniref:BZIP domain-containing protein n=1 Tax=Rhodotorula paludigena TaxID=86838 RepID=A0AAV5GB78_9BASI|nr:hypothetical protein Rhopal_002678-T1 [Rhodotorula paludigena]